MLSFIGVPLVIMELLPFDTYSSVVRLCTLSFIGVSLVIA